jgi:8-oxo-dGTP pyrophosphatase MutT (NUDIX family)
LDHIIITHEFIKDFLLKIFINDIPVFLLKNERAKPQDQYDHILDGRMQRIVSKQLIDDVLIHDASEENVDELLRLMTEKKLKNVDSITFISKKVKPLKRYIKSTFKVVEAAGGVVEKDGKNLLIYRKGKWDLPKGKLDDGETVEECATREVEEETGVKVKISYKIGHTWHTYIQNRKYVLKKTHWYVMDCIDDTALAPQKAEGIKEACWKSLSEIRRDLYDSYRSIRSVYHDYLKLLKEHTKA